MNSTGLRFSTAASAALVLGWGLVSPVPVAAQGLPQPVVPQGFGVNIHFTQPQPGEMEKIADGGFGVVRMDVLWQQVEKTKGVYDFTAYDGLTANLLKHGIRPLYILCYGNPLYDGGLSPHTDAGRAAYAAFAAAAAGHFKGKGVLWEIWNEPNSNTFWRPRADPEAYVAMAIPAARAIRAADPTATILAPGSSRFFPWSYLDTIFRRGLLKEIDAVSVHPYRFPATAPETAAADYAKLRRLIATYTPVGQPQRPIVCSEWGYSTFEKGVSEAQQARFLVREWLSNLANGVNLTVFYDWKNDGTNPKDMEAFFGTVNRDLTPKPAFLAARALIQDLRGYRFVHRLESTAPDDYRLIFQRDADIALVSWNADPAASEAEQTPVVRKVASTEAEYASLRRVAAIEYPALGLVATPAQTASLEFSLTNPETTPAQIKVSVGDKTQTVTLAKGQSRHIPWPLPVETVSDGSGAVLSVRVSWNGQIVEGLPAVQLQTAYPLLLTAAPTSAGVRVEITNPQSAAFSGEVRAIIGGKVTAGKVALAPEETQSMNLAMDRSQPAVLNAVDARGAVWGRVGPFALNLVPDFPAAVGATGPWEIVNHVKGAPQRIVAVTAAAPPEGAPILAAVPVAFEPDPNAVYVTVRPKTDTLIPEKATAAVLWVYSDGCGISLNARFKDATGQVFQPTLSDLKFTGWRAITIPFSGEMWHYGGANDGIPHGQLSWDSLVVLDTGKNNAAKGRIWIGEPSYAIGEAAVPGLW